MPTWSCPSAARRNVRASSRNYRADAPAGMAWDLVLCGGGPGSEEVSGAIEASGLSHAIHRPGFLQAGPLARWLAHASAFVHPSRMEPWGLVANEAALSALGAPGHPVQGPDLTRVARPGRLSEQTSMSVGCHLLGQVHAFRHP